jgi:hypothetical protein
MAPRDITPGDISSALFAGIQRADDFAVFSAHANQSSQVKREVSHAIRRGMSVLPFRLDDTVHRARSHSSTESLPRRLSRRIVRARVATLEAAATRHTARQRSRSAGR